MMFILGIGLGQFNLIFAITHFRRQLRTARESDRRRRAFIWTFNIFAVTPVALILVLAPSFGGWLFPLAADAVRHSPDCIYTYS